jgi:predicted esterase
MTGDPHASGPVLMAGEPLGSAQGVVVLLHGRGASAEDILGLTGVLGEGLRLAFVAPQAAGSTWYPQSFLAERSENEPYVTSALKQVESVVKLLETKGFAREKIAIGGFSQGACLTTEFVATHPAKWAGAIAFTGGLIGAPGSDVRHAGDLHGVPVLLTSGDPDPHVPWTRVEETAQVLQSMGATVTLRRWPGKPHSVSGEEIRLARELLLGAFGSRA